MRNIPHLQKCGVERRGSVETTHHTTPLLGCGVWCGRWGVVPEVWKPRSKPAWGFGGFEGSSKPSRPTSQALYPSVYGQTDSSPRSIKNDPQNPQTPQSVGTNHPAATCWQAAFDERAGFLEFDGGYSRTETKRGGNAAEAANARWGNANGIGCQPHA